MMFRILLLLVVCKLCLTSGRNSHVIRDISLRVPKPFIVSTSLGMNSSNKKKDMPTGVVIRNKTPHDRRKYNDKFYNFQSDDMKKFVSSLPIGQNSPKINFYHMNCAVGHRCSAIIPGPKTELPSPKIRTDNEMRTYLKKHGLLKGFNYSNKDRVNKNSIVARYFRENEEKKETARNARRSRNISYRSLDSNSYWPGSEYRPNIFTTQHPKVRSKANVYKYGAESNSNRNPSPTSWNRDHSPSYNFENKFNIVHQLPSPSFSNYNTDNQNRRKSNTRNSKKGVWTTFSNSMVSQYDKNNNEWVKISSSNKDSGTEYVNIDAKPTTLMPSSYESYSNKNKGVGVTSFGFSGESDLHYQKPIPSSYQPEYNPIPSSYYPKPSDGYFPSTYPQPTKPSSVSFPLNVIPQDFSDPVLVFSNVGLTSENDGDSNITSSTDLPFSTFDFSDYVDLTNTSVNKTIIPLDVFPTKPTPPAPKVITIVNPAPVIQQQQQQQQQQQPQQQQSSTLITNAYAVMAAVGAGLIPASIVAILPVLLGKRRRRSLYQSPSNLTPLERRLPSDPIVKFLLNSY